MYKMFIDDERFPISEDFVVVRSSQEAITLVELLGIPSYISFDHDLGGEDTAIVFIKWLVDYLLDNNKRLPKDFSYFVHSQNPIGKANIEGWMDQIVGMLSA